MLVYILKNKKAILRLLKSLQVFFFCILYNTSCFHFVFKISMSFTFLDRVFVFPTTFTWQFHHQFKKSMSFERVTYFFFACFTVMPCSFAIFSAKLFSIRLARPPIVYRLLLRLEPWSSIFMLSNTPPLPNAVFVSPDTPANPKPVPIACPAMVADVPVSPLATLPATFSPTSSVVFIATVLPVFPIYLL